jgi:hypothetical protein
LIAPFELSVVGGPWARRLGPRRRRFDRLPWNEPLAGTDEARWTWTQTAFSELASAAAFAEIASALLATGAPLDLVAAAGDFVVDELVHAEVAARLAGALGGAVALDVDLEKLVRPPAGDRPLLAALELIVRTCCVGEALTVPMLRLSRKLTASPLCAGVIRGILSDETHHAQLGWWCLDWAAPQLAPEDREHLAKAASKAVLDYAPIFGGACDGTSACAVLDRTFASAVERNVVRPLAEREIHLELAPG